MREITILTESFRMLNTGVISNVDMQIIVILINAVKNNSHLFLNFVPVSDFQAQKTPQWRRFWW